MNLLKLIITILFMSTTIFGAYGFVDPVTVIAVSSLGSAVYLMLNSNSPASNAVVENIVKTTTYLCQKVGYCEGCEDKWIPENIDHLEYDLKSNVFGQPLAVDITLTALRRHLSRHNVPDRALMLSFHGGPGTGKNFISTKIIKTMFKNQEKSKFVHFFRSAIDFPEKNKINEYKKIIADTVKSKVLECHRSVFVFDEIEKMPDGILDVLTSFVKTGSFGDYDFRRVIFILLSNVGDKTIIHETLQNWKAGVDREDMDERPLNMKLSKEAFNTKGGFFRTGLVKQFSVSHYVPFLPLERQHVTQCLEREVVSQQQIMSEELVEQVLEELPFGPPPEDLYSYAGCKGVAEKASVLIEREILRKRRAQKIER